MGYSYKEKVDGKTASIELTDMETATAVSVCNINNVDKITCMKKDDGGAIFFANPNAANAAQQRHNFKYSFVLDKDELTKALPKETKK